MTSARLVAEARVKLADPLTTALELCSHFREHGSVTRTPVGGVIENDFGLAELRAEGTHLHLRAEGVDATALYVVRNALAEHLALFVEGELPPFTWSGDTPASQSIPFFREMRVVEARQVTPGMRRVTLRGGDVGAFENGAGLHVRLLIPPAGRAPVWPTPAPDGRTLWPKGEDALTRRVYTVRRVDRAAGTIDIDMVLHGDGDERHGSRGGASPGSVWAASALPGERVGVMGPGGAAPPQADWYVLAGDETALPVIARIIEGLPSGSRVIACIEVANAGEEQPIHCAGDLRLSWLHRDGAPAGSTGLLHQALREIVWPTQGHGHVLVGCEHGAARAIRSWLIAERGMTKKNAHVAAYWRLGRGGDSAAEEQERD